MPIKAFKRFARRKSAGSLLDPAWQDSSSTSIDASFRVLSRIEIGDGRISSFNGTTSRRPTSSPLKSTLRHESFDVTQVSNRTNASTSTGASDRFSYHSTQPSSVESHSPDDLTPGLKVVQPNSSWPMLRQSHDAYEEPDSPQHHEAKPRPSFSSAISNKFSLSRSKLKASPSRENSDVISSRDRSVTASSYGSTATTTHAPSLDVRLDNESTGDWFENFKRRSTILEESTSTSIEEFRAPLPPPPAARSGSDTLLAAKKQFLWEEHDGRPSPLSNRLQKSPSPDRAPRRSWESNASQRAFVSRGAYRSTASGYQQSVLASNQGLPSSQASPSLNPPDEKGLPATAWASQELDRQYVSPPSSYHNLPDRSRLDDCNNGRSTTVPQISHNCFTDESLQSSNATTHRAAKFPDENTSLFEISRAKSRSVTQERKSMLPNTNRVMTPAEFEDHKQHSANRRDDDEPSQKSDDSVVFEDEDEEERSRQIAKQRRKQEAQLAVYRQQMMKVTGEQPTDLLDCPEITRSSQSMPNLSRISLLDSRSEKYAPPGKISDDSDEDVPLGVLQAHGFPSTSRPPTRLINSSTISQLRPASQNFSCQAPPGFSRNDVSAGGGGNPALPVFARNLPKDPYVGAGLVNASNRESMKYSSPLPPGGLIGVIAGEERARAMRRGSPNSNGVYGQQSQPRYSMIPGQIQMPHHGMPPIGMGMPFTPIGQPLTPSEISQMEMNNQMAQMMQMQMQFMQQMMAMQGQPGAMQMQIPNFNMMMPQQAQSDAGINHTRPDSQLSTRQNQRISSAMSQMGQNRQSSLKSGYFGNGSAVAQPNYAPSIAPSERSNIGQPSRYRPVTPSGIYDSRANSMAFTSTPNIHMGINNPRQRSRSPHKLDLPGEGLGAVPPSSTIRAINKPKKGSGAGAGSDDEEDDAAWADLRRKREERKNRWTMRKKEKESSEMPKEGLEGLYYDG